MCTKANPTMSESSAAGYQLRRHYQKHLLALECIETGQNVQNLLDFAEKLKKKKKDKDPNAQENKKHAQQPGANSTPMQQQTPTTAYPHHSQGKKGYMSKIRYMSTVKALKKFKNKNLPKLQNSHISYRSIQKIGNFVVELTNNQTFISGELSC